MTYPNLNHNSHFDKLPLKRLGDFPKMPDCLEVHLMALDFLNKFNYFAFCCLLFSGTVDNLIGRVRTTESTGLKD